MTIHTESLRFTNSAIVPSCDDNLMGVMKMGNTVHRAGNEPTSLAFQASVLPLHHVSYLMSPLYKRLPGYAAP